MTAYATSWREADVNLLVCLTDVDRERYGCAETLPVDVLTVTMREAIAMQPLGFTHPAEWRDALFGEKETDADGKVTRKRGNGYVPALAGLVWLALNRNGHQVGLDDLDFTLDGLRISTENAGEQQGKGRSTRRTTSKT